MDSECAKDFHNIEQSTPYYAEISVMDNLSANLTTRSSMPLPLESVSTKLKNTKRGYSNTGISITRF